ELFLKNLFARLTSLDKQEIMNTLNERIDERGRIHLRFDKQKAYKGEIVYSSFDDIIKVVITFVGKKKTLANELSKLIE
ncbi:MAG TPA: RNA-binding domain-containing protein, partial [Geobacterales bacterium]|nr:RNA-binding domain-containing protein [Geobacterales bacterium]